MIRNDTGGESMTPQEPGQAPAYSPRGDSVLQRIWRYKLHYVIVIPAMLLLVCFKFIPLLTAFYLPFIDYAPFRGLANSEWVGLENFRQLFGRYEIYSIIHNTWIIKLGSVVVSGLLALVLALNVSAIRWGRLRSALATIFLIPYVIPTVVFAYIGMHWLSSSNPLIQQLGLFPLADAGMFQPIAIVLEALRICGIPALLAIAAIGAQHAKYQHDSDVLGRSPGYGSMNVVPALRAVAAFMIIQLSSLLSPHFELLHSLVNPLVYETGDTLGTYAYRTGFLNGSYSIGAAIWLLQFIVNLTFGLIAYLLVRGLFVRDLFTGQHGSREIRAARGGSHVAGVVVGGALGLAALLPLYTLFVLPYVQGSSSTISVQDVIPFSRTLLYATVFGAAVLVHLLMTLTLAYPLTVKRLPGRQVYKFILLLALFAGSGTLHEYFFFHSLGTVNTFFPLLFNGFFGIVSVFVLKSYFNARFSDLKAQSEAEGRGELRAFFMLFMPKVWKPLLALGVLHFITLWNSYLSPLIYISDPERYPPVMRFMNFMHGGAAELGLPPGDPFVLMLGAWVTLPSVLLLLLFSRWLTSEVWVSQSRG